MRSSKRREWLSPALALLLAACARPAPAPPQAQLNSTETVAAYAAREAAIHTLRAQFTAVATAADGARRRVSGAFLVSRPTNAARFRLMLPFGVTVLDYVKDGTDDWLTLPLAGVAYSPNLVALGIADPPTADVRSGAFTADLMTSYLRRGALSDCQVSTAQNGEVVAVCGDRYLILSTGDGTLLEDRRQDVSLRYSDQRPVDGVLLPFAIAIRRDGASVAVAVDRYDLNPTLDPALFDLPPGAEREPVHIDHR
jgi:hypothetical protein